MTVHDDVLRMLGAPEPGMALPAIVTGKAEAAAMIGADHKRFRRTGHLACPCPGRELLAIAYADSETGCRWVRVGQRRGRGQSGEKVVTPAAALPVDTPPEAYGLLMSTCRHCQHGVILSVGAGRAIVTGRFDGPTRGVVVE